MEQHEIQVNQKLPFLKSLPLSFQHLFAMFGSTVLVPVLFKIDPATILFMNGIGTLLYILITKGKIPAYLGSSFAFISPVFAVLAKHADLTGYSYALGGFLAVGIILVIVALIVKIAGTRWIEVVFPPAAMGAIVAVIGLQLVPTAAQMAGLVQSDASVKHWSPDPDTITVSLLTLAITVVCWVTLRGFLKIIPILIGIICGYLISLAFGIVDLKPVQEAAWISLPTYYPIKLNWSDIMMIVPAALVIIPEHIGHLIVTGNIVKKDLTKDPGLDRSLLGNGISTILSSFVGATPNTTYGENIGVLAITRVYSTWVIGGAAVLAIILSFCGKLAALISSIPQPVMGGISLLLFGVIAASGLRMLVEQKVDYGKSQNLILTCLVLAVGLSGATINIGTASLSGMGLATVVAIIVSLFFKLLNVLHLENE
ncbi:MULTISPECIES: uracil permease [Heyndrickxia]|uniref:uracil permease n=1 Tax=Heyndrickxia TaxID=2837504 RepID=UPI0005519F2D|nr:MULTISPECIES: uracil permease [Heyndrickxia]NWN93611.1 uracil permease [Bacillus sp. (in: firmicutes)]APB37719.1 uracil permease [Heyndrickxia coagulans]KGT39487.1 uracil transporter [Heyndrickxia coagulans P38]MED4320539.1 uracil permease [Weizmannia sp. CD-2023]MED4838955.1 uracil permease [Weizmannia sp. CD-2023]